MSAWKDRSPTMSDHTDDIPNFAPDDELDHPMRVLVVLKSDQHPDGHLDERTLASVRTHGEMNTFFDEFDDKIAMPNEGNIKYEVGSDGLVLILLDNEPLHKSVVKFIDEYLDEDVGEESSKKRTRI